MPIPPDAFISYTPMRATSRWGLALPIIETEHQKRAHARPRTPPMCCVLPHSVTGIAMRHNVSAATEHVNCDIARTADLLCP